MKTTIGFAVRLFTPLTSAAALGRDGFDIALHADPIGGDGLKGAMRHAGRGLVPDELLRATFGGPSRPSPWQWSPLRCADGWRVADRHRVRIDASTGAAAEDQLVRAEHVWPEEASFTVTQIGGDQACTETRLALTTCARAVTALGAWTNRAYGWVEITPLADDGSPRPMTDDEWTTVLGWGTRS